MFGGADAAGNIILFGKDAGDEIDLVAVGHRNEEVVLMTFHGEFFAEIMAGLAGTANHYAQVNLFFFPRITAPISPACFG